MTNSERNFATATHLSALTQYFIPLGNFILPIVIWSSKKEQSSFVDDNGKQIINFQLSLLVYSLLIAFISIPLIAYNFLNKIPLNQMENFDFNTTNWSDFAFPLTVGIIAVLLFAFMKISEFILIILAAVSASNNKSYKYPLTINFLK